MQAFTPTAASAAIAGFGFWALVWSIALKLDTIAALFGFRGQHFSKRIRRWINQNKGLTICMTETLNLGMHGVTNPAGVTFAIGGTIFNILYVFLINPFICWKEDRKSPLAVKSTTRKVHGITTV